ncbi:polyprenol monophosphomannose synthase [Candidatus Bathyarchaeota archaeon A05DMB-2]|jgi:dolichol-phosphate mannosyltransferase|nr:polyprenol monophosphomannose synthase [Candidatus Bathyarchaeota archaeon A05DMB-2]
MSYQLTGSLGNAEVGVILPTYREAENIAKLIDEIKNLPLDTSILVIDDSSPDATSENVRNMQKKYGNILLCIRPRKGGLGTAITDGFKIFLSLKNPPKHVIAMDADYSHNPQAIPQLLSEARGGCGIVIGSRYCRGGGTSGWPFTRKIISRVANLVAKSIVGFKTHDCTSGFRCYSTEFLKVTVGGLHSQTYEIQIETVRQALSRGFSVKETPILFSNRKRGKSKLSLTEVWSYVSYTLKTLLHGSGM